MVDRTSGLGPALFYNSVTSMHALMFLHFRILYAQIESQLFLILLRMKLCPLKHEFNIVSVSQVLYSLKLSVFEESLISSQD